MGPNETYEMTSVPVGASVEMFAGGSIRLSIAPTMAIGSYQLGHLRNGIAGVTPFQVTV